MAKDYDRMEDSNRSSNLSIHEVSDLRRRTLIRGGLAAAATGLLAPLAGCATGGAAGRSGPLLGFKSVPVSTADAVTVPEGYTAQVLAPWGEAVGLSGEDPAFKFDGSNTAAEQETQLGMHHDGIHFFRHPLTPDTSNAGLLVMNHEYADDGLLHADGMATWTAAKVRKSQAAHGVSIFELRRVSGNWTVVSNSPYGRRLTANTPMEMSGPAAGHALLQTKVYNITPTGSVDTGNVSNGITVYGTQNNCAHGYTPWGTYLACEENWNGYFGTTTAGTDSNFVINVGNAATESGKNFRRYGVTPNGFGYRWHIHDPRFDVTVNPNEANLFGWVVEVDPYNPNSVPKKRTALGRFKHESAQYAVSADALGTPNRVAFYQGDDERNEYIYKFVASQPYNPSNRLANANILDNGILYVARFLSTPVSGKPNVYRGEWIALLPGTIGAGGVALRDNPNFSGANDAEVLAKILIKTRMAADAVGATMMDRPEWTALRTYNNRAFGTYSEQQPLEVYCTLTNNSLRGGSTGGVFNTSNNADGSTASASANPAVDVANPRPDNDYGHIVRWREDGNFVTATGFEWDIFVLAGDTQFSSSPGAKTLAATYTATNLVPGSGSGAFYQGDIVDSPDGSANFGAPDGLWFDQFGRLWIQTDQVGDASGDWRNIGSNTMLCADPNTKEIRRFFTSPRNCEVTGVINTPDGKTMFVGIQHPGENSTSANPTQFSNWPQGQWATNSAGVPLPNTAARRPRSSLVVITKDDGGVIGS